MDTFKKTHYFTKRLSLFLFFAGLTQFAIGQITYQPYSYQRYQYFQKELYNDTTLGHTAVKPLVKKSLGYSDDPLRPADTSKNWFLRKIFDEHLVQIVKEDHTFYLDFLPDLIVGTQRGTDQKNLWTNTRGAQAGLTVGEKFSLYVNFFENQARFPTHIDNSALRIGGLPGQGFSKNVPTSEFDWMNTTVNMTYEVDTAFRVTLAYDKLHIGDGYRSMLVSESPYNFAHAHFSGKVKRFQYNSIWGTMLDRFNPREYGGDQAFTTRLGEGVKYAAFQYVDYLATNNLTIGAFHSLIWAQDHGLEESGANGGLGLNVKYRPIPKWIIYGQLYADQLSKFSFNKDSDRRTSYQFGVKTHDLFNVDRLNATVEFNQAATYTYQNENNRINYSNNGEPIAHPNGANFREILGILTYRWKRFDLYGQGMYARYGVDPDVSTNVGQDIFRQDIPQLGNRIGQGDLRNLFYNELRAAYIINPRYNLRAEVGFINRIQNAPNSIGKTTANIFTIGLRSTFRTFQTEY
ncbi:gliding motility protein RemB [Sphingobacterium chungjuense]|uniref:gliding motility protein RemB n=1 Tax=Sphingobacterium chungjuense TaxID=2675553 RepID=UPI0014094C3D|nr:gliding motility protein RemB [Sphingobacterium chungjuense]